MSTAILRTATAWRVANPSGAVRIDTAATTTAELLADRNAIDRASGDPVPVESSPASPSSRSAAWSRPSRSHPIPTRPR
jgi:hypothetical protein